MGEEGRRGGEGAQVGGSELGGVGGVVVRALTGGAERVEVKARVGVRNVRGRRPRLAGDRSPGWRNAPGPLTPRGRSSVGGHKEALRTAEITVRRARVVQMFVEEQLTYAAIAERLGVSNWTVANDLAESMAALNAQRLQDINHRRLVEIARSERVDRKLLPGLDSGDARVRAATAEALRGQAEFRARLDGLYAKNEDAWSSAEIVQFVLGFTRELLTEFTDDEAKRRIHRIYARRASHLLPDVTVEAVREAGAADEKGE